MDSSLDAKSSRCYIVRVDDGSVSYFSESTLEALARDRSRLAESVAAGAVAVNAAKEAYEMAAGEQRERLHALEHFDRLLGGLTALDSAGATHPIGLDESDDTRISRNSAASLVEQVRSVLEQVGPAGAHYREITASLAKSGINVGGKDPAASVLAILAAKRYGDKFIRVARGRYCLATADRVAQLRHTKRRSKKRVAAKKVA